MPSRETDLGQRAQERPESDHVVEAGGVPTEDGTVGQLAGQPTLGEVVPAAGASPGPRRERKYGIGFYLSLAWLLIVAVCAVAADWLPVQDPNKIAPVDKILPVFSEGHVLGTDGLGRDTFARLIHGAQVSLVISLAAVGIGMFVGGTLGMTVGFFRGRLETVVMALIDVILAFPGLVLLLALVAFVGQSLSTITLVIGFLSIPVYTRVARANTLSVSQREYVLAARAQGATNSRILFREILPNVALPVAAFGLVALGVVIVLEGALAFLGLSVQAPQATWGSMIAEGKRHLTNTAHVALIPSLAMFFTVLSLNFVGDTLRSKFDVREANI